MDPYNFESLIQSGTQIIIPLQKPNLNLYSYFETVA